MIRRELTAISRSALSKPMQCLDKKGLLSGRYTVMDYGCGQGDDVFFLKKRGIDIVGYDPYFSPNVEKRESDIVNLGFVLNVIEDPIERVDVLIDSFLYAKELLVVSCRVTDSNSLKFEKYGDGVITKRKTFQKYYRNDEFKEFLDKTLNAKSIKMENGIFFISKFSF